MICDNIQLNSTLYLRIKSQLFEYRSDGLALLEYGAFTVLLSSTFGLSHGRILQLLNTFPL